MLTFFFNYKQQCGSADDLPRFARALSVNRYTVRKATLPVFIIVVYVLQTQCGHKVNKPLQRQSGMIFGLEAHDFGQTGQENIIPTCRSAGNYY